jgi:hypothetical protein
MSDTRSMAAGARGVVEVGQLLPPVVAHEVNEVPAVVNPLARSRDDRRQ